MAAPIIERDVPMSACTAAPGRPIRGVVLHHTATQFDPFPASGGSWHYLVRRDGTIYGDVSVQHAAHHAASTDVWRPPWVVPSQVNVSDINWSSIGVEITYAPQAPYYETPNGDQHWALRVLMQDLYARFGPLPVVGHGQIQSDKWATEPHGLDWYACGLTVQDSWGRWLGAEVPVPPDTPTPGEDETVVDISDEDLKAYLESYGVGVNMETALIQRACLAYRRGETRGPAISGEYPYAGRTRQRFTAAIAEYNPDTGEVSWVEAIAYPEG